MSVTTRTAGTPAEPAGTGEPPAISIRGVCKTFNISSERYGTLKERALHGFRTGPAQTLRALDDVNLDIARGEFFGIVGRNGSGKSTLLKCIAGIYAIDSGALEVHGRLSPFIELGVGFNAELTARDNVIINAIMLGLSRKEAFARYEDIVSFAGLQEFMDLRLKNFSSGMHVRLAFAVAIQLDADIVLIDEVLAVGDAAFQQKCFEQFDRLKRDGRTIIFVTHDMGAIERFCDRAMLVDHGRVIDIGEPASVARQYNDVNFHRIRREAIEQGGPEPMRGEPVAQIVQAVFEGQDGKPIHDVTQGETTVARMEVYFHTEAIDPIFAFVLEDEHARIAFAASTQLTHAPTGRFGAGSTATVRIRFDNWLAPGLYRLMTSVARPQEPVLPYDVRQGITSIVIRADRHAGGVVDFPHSFAIVRGEDGRTPDSQP